MKKERLSFQEAGSRSIKLSQKELQSCFANQVDLNEVSCTSKKGLLVSVEEFESLKRNHLYR